MSTFDNPFDSEPRSRQRLRVRPAREPVRARSRGATAVRFRRKRSGRQRGQALRRRRRFGGDARDVSPGRRAARLPAVGRRLHRARGDLASSSRSRPRRTCSRRAATPREEGSQGRLHSDHLRDADHHGAADGLLCEAGPQRRSGQDRRLGGDPRQDAQQGIRRRAHAVADAARDLAGRRLERRFPTRCRRSRTSTARRSRWRSSTRTSAIRRQWKGFKFAVPFDYSMHNYLLRYYLAEHGLDPDTDVQIRSVPPPEMVANLRADNIDGFLAPDPVNQRAVYDGVGFIHMLSKELWDGHPCCAFAAAKEFVTQTPEHLCGAAEGDHRRHRLCRQGGEPQADRRGDRAGQLPQPAGDGGRAGADRHLSPTASAT